MTPSEIQTSPANPPAAAAPATAAHDHGFSFHDFLSAMNPLQYLPVVGTIYRAVTGDVIPEAVRDAGSMLVSGLLGGPIGLISYIAATIAEKVTGIDPEKIVAVELNRSPATPTTPAAPTTPAEVPTIALAAAPTAAPPAPVAPAPVAPAPIAPTLIAPAVFNPAVITSARRALTAEQLAAYGVRSDSPGTLKLGDIEGADVLNLMELTRLREAAAAYAANQIQPLPAAATGD